MRTVIGILIAVLGVYLISQGQGLDKPIGFGVGGLAMMIVPGGSEPLASVFIGVLFIIVAIIWGVSYVENEKNGTNAKRRAAELEQINQEYYEAVESQQSGEPWRVRYATEPCPHCGHYKVRNAKWEDKQLSVAFWGVASSKLGKNFKCEHCGNMW